MTQFNQVIPIKHQHYLHDNKLLNYYDEEKKDAKAVCGSPVIVIIIVVVVVYKDHRSESIRGNSGIAKSSTYSQCSDIQALKTMTKLFHTHAGNFKTKAQSTDST